MAIIQLQRRLHEIGRIRLGQQIESKSGKKRPASLDTFRLTSSDRSRIAEAAGLYGGTVTTWDAPSGRQEFEVITKTDRLPVVVPPSAMAFSQHYELWSAGGCQRRCDGVTETIAVQSGQPCLCDPENRQCQIHTRLSVMLRDLSGLGVWRVDTQGYYAAVELQGAVEVISLAAGRGQMLPATLRLEQRTIKRVDEGTRHFVVPILDIDISPAALLMGTVSVEPSQPPKAALTAVPDGGPPPSIADQVKSADDIPSRRRPSTATLPSTGIVPRTAAQAAKQGERSWQEPFDQETDAPMGEEPRDETGEETQDPPRMVTKGQLTKLLVALRERGFNDDSPQGREARLDWCAKVINRRIGSAKELTYAEAKQVIDFLEKPAEEEVSEPADEPQEDPVDTGEQIGLHLVPPGEGGCTAEPPGNEQIGTIVELYKAKGVTGSAVLDDITAFLQKEQHVASLHALTSQEADAVIRQVQTDKE